MRVLAHRGNRLHAPENTKIALVSAYTAGAGALELDVQLTKDGRLVVSHDPTTKRLAGENHAIIETDLAELRKLDVGETFKPRGASEFHYRRPEKPGDQIETFPHLLGELPDEVPKVVEMKHDSSLETGRRDEFERLPDVRIAAFDWELSPDEQVGLIERHEADGVVIELGAVLGVDGALTDAGKRLEQLHADRGLRVGAIVYLYRDPAVFTREEYEALQSHDFVWSLATDSMLDVQPFVRQRQQLVSESFAGTATNTRQFSLGYAKANPYAHVRQEDGVHVDISEYHGKLKGDSALEEGVWYALRDWPFYSGGGVGYVDGIEGDFVAEVSYEASRVGQASTLEMAAINVPPAAHRGRCAPTAAASCRASATNRTSSTRTGRRRSRASSTTRTTATGSTRTPARPTTTTGTAGPSATARRCRAGCAWSGAARTSPPTTGTTTTHRTGCAWGWRATTRSTSAC